MNRNKSIKKRLTAYLMLFIMLFGCMSAVRAAEIRNATDTTSVPGWTLETHNSDSGGYIDSSEFASGSKSLKLYNNTVKTGDDCYFAATYRINVEKGASYRYGFKIKVKNADRVTCFMNWISPRANLLPTGSTAGWRDFEFNYTHATDENTATLRIILDSKTEAVWIDNIYYYKVGDSTNTNLISNPSFEEGNSKGNSAGGGAQAISDVNGRGLIAVPYKENMQIDGDLNDWEGIAEIPLTDRIVYKGNLTLDAGIRYAYDNENLYFAVVAEDDVHNPILQSDTYWTGDGIQFTVCGTNDRFGYGYGFACDPQSGNIYNNSYDNLQYGFRREGTQSIYEVAIPWTDYFPNGKQDAALFCLIVNDNDGDDNGRKGCVMVSEGIASDKKSDEYPLLLMADNHSGYTAWLSGSTESMVGRETEYSIDLFNTSERELSLSLKSTAGKKEEQVSVPAGAHKQYRFKVMHVDMGEREVDMTVSDGTAEKQLTFTTNVLADADTTRAVIAKHREEYAELSGLINECKNKGMQIKYEESGHAVLGQFANYIEDNLSRNDTSNVYYQDKELTEIYETTKAKLTAYLNGTAQPVSAPSYVTSNVSVVGKHFEATVENNGVLEQSPVFFVGAGHWAPSRKEIPVLSKIGFNTMQPELGVSQFMSSADPLFLGWSRDSTGYNCTAEISTTEKHGGNNALKLSSKDPQKENIYWYMAQKVEVKPNTTYEYGLWAKSVEARKTWFSVDPKWSWDRRNWVSGTINEWTEMKAEYTTGENETALWFYIFNEEATTAAWLDDAYLKEKGGDKNLLVNGDFEQTNDGNIYWSVNEEAVENFAKDFDRMAEYNISGILSTAPHLVPQTFRDDFPEAMSPRQPYFSTQTILDHPQTRAMYETYYRTIMPRLAEKPAFNGIILMNEPEYLSNREVYYAPLFREEMQKKYGSIEKLNATWGTNYTEFDQVAMPTMQEATPQFHDWREFNDQILPNYNRFAADIVREYDKNVFITTKMMQTMFTNDIKRVDACNNWETMAPSIDINGCDAYTNYATRNTYSIRTQDIFYDYQTSIKNTPVYNTEEHIFYFANQIGYSEEERAHNIAALWQGAVHGKGGTVVWFWDRTGASQKGGESYYSTLTERPATVAAIGKMTMDLNRLAKEVVSITESQANVGMLYSMDNTSYAMEYMNMIDTAYAKLGENGQKTQFIVESAMDKLKDVKCLVVPHVITVKDSSFEAIEQFVGNGGKLVVLGKDSLAKDEYGHSRDTAKVAALLAKAEVVDVANSGSFVDAASKEKVGEVIRKVVREGNYSNISVIDKTTGKPLTDCEYLTAEYEGKTIINLCTYRDDDREIEIYVGGKKAEQFTDLISTETYSGSAQVKAYTPMLIRIEG